MPVVLKCKMCGGDIEVVPGTTVGTCQYCGSTMTLPQIDSDKALRMYDRANTYRLSNEFDKAYDAYKAIVEEDEQAAEAYWGMLLSEYGIEYVEDPKTHKRIPTCHRTLTQSILESANYKLACQYADAESRFLYQEEAETIDKIQKHIMAVSSREEPYDVFISYKELNDATGQRTEASVLAQEIYDALTKEGVRVFFSRISLEDKLGADYEPCIYAALRSSKVLLLVATDPAQCDAVWVRNEWSRYLKFMEEDHNKTIVPVFKTMTAYEFPHELQRFQAQDMGKLGAMQDLVRGVLKLAEFDEKKKSASTTDVIVATMLKRAEESLQKKDWDKAAEYFNNVLDYDVNNVDAYIGRLLVERKCVSMEDLTQQTQTLEASENYKKLIVLCSKEQKEKFKTIEEKIQQNHATAQVLQKKRNKRIAIASTAAVLAAAVAVGAYFTATKVIIPEKNYKAAIASYDSGDYETAIEYFKNHLDYKESVNYLSKCRYQSALEKVSEGNISVAKDEMSYVPNNCTDLWSEFNYQVAVEYEKEDNLQEALDFYKKISGYKDSSDKVAELEQQIAEEAVKSAYEAGQTAMNTQEYDKAIQFFTKAGDYSDAPDQILEAKYQYCVQKENDPDDTVRAYILELVGAGYKDSVDIQNIIHQWHATVTAEESLLVGNYGAIGIKALLSGGSEGETTRVRFEVTHDGDHFSYTPPESYAEGETAACSLTIDSISADWLSYISVVCYDSNGNVIGSYEGPIEEI